MYRNISSLWAELQLIIESGTNFQDQNFFEAEPHALACGVSRNGGGCGSSGSDSCNGGGCGSSGMHGTGGHNESSYLTLNLMKVYFIYFIVTLFRKR